MRVRPFEPDDIDFLGEMLYEAAFWRPGRARPPREEALADPYLVRYIEAWGRPGDAAVVAIHENGQPMGAAWYRLFPSDRPGYGFIDPGTPELSIAVAAPFRRKGVGANLLGALIELGRADGYAALSLSVEPDNPALALYESHGFVKISTVKRAWTMRLDVSVTPEPIESKGPS